MNDVGRAVLYRRDLFFSVLLEFRQTMAQYEIQRTTGCCKATGDALQEGQVFYTVLYDDEGGFRREDFSVEHWSGPPEGAFCHFKTRVPVKEKRKKLLVDDELLENLFLRLEEEKEEHRVHFRFVLALILMRKRLLRYERSTRKDDAEVWEMTLMRDKSAQSVANPHLSDDQIDSVSEQISSIMHGDMGEWGEAAEEAASAKQSTETEEEV